MDARLAVLSGGGFEAHGDPPTWWGRIAPVIVRRDVVQVLSLSASCAQAQKSLEHSVEQKSHSCANLAPQTRHIRHRLSCASVPPDFIDQKEKGISDQSEGEIDENGVFHCFSHELVRGLAYPPLSIAERLRRWCAARSVWVSTFVVQT